MKHQDEYLSLYDYLGKAAGEKLGKEVRAYASQNGVATKYRSVSNPKYTGAILLYPKQFLELYFRPQVDTTSSENPTDDLPFPEDFNYDADDDLPF